MKKIIFFLISGLTSWGSAYPMIMDWHNAPMIVDENNKHAVLKRKQLLKFAFSIVTSRMDEIQLKINTKNELYMYQNSKIQINEIFEDEDQPLTIFGLEGSFRIQNFPEDKNETQILNQVKTVFFDLPQPHQSDAVIQMNPKEPSVEIKMIKGSWDLSFYAYEKKITLKAGQQVKFKGVLEDNSDQIKYDFLLDGKKVPQGKLEEIKKFSVAAYKASEKATQAEIVKKDLQAKRKIQEVLIKKKQYEDSFLCKKPFAQINQCAWRLESEKCYRQRCNVSGKWGDKTERPVSEQCTKDFLIGKCDY
jgi:hypothetical protein